MVHRISPSATRVSPKVSASVSLGQVSPNVLPAGYATNDKNGDLTGDRLKVWLDNWGDSIIGGKSLDRETAIALTKIEGESDVLALCAVADRVRQARCGNVVDLCSIVNVKSGSCSENCGFCSQSAHHPGEGSPVYGLKPRQEIMAQARSAALAGAKRFCLVSQGRGPAYGGEQAREFEEILETVRQIIAETDIKPCCALGELTVEQAEQLKAAGVTRYNHNLEASESFFPEVVTTHRWRDRVETVKNLRSVGIQACSGGIMGMGESWEDRVDLALALRDLGVESVPLNLLNPRAGTPMGDRDRLDPYEALKAIAIFRLILPEQIIRYAGGREAVMGDLQHMGLKAGINAMLIGHYLTTLGQPPENDKKMLHDLGLEGGEAPVPGTHGGD